MADVKIPALLHKMSKTAQKAWYKKQGMEMPSETGGKSAAAAKKVKVEPRKTVAAKQGSVRALNLAKQKGYYEKGGRQPIGAGGSGGHSSMAGSNMSTAKGIISGIKAGFNPKVSLDPYESEKAKKVGPRSLKLKNESIEEASRLDLIKRAAASSRMGKNVFLSKVNARAAQLTQQKRDDKVTKSKLNYGMSSVPFNNEEVEQVEEMDYKPKQKPESNYPGARLQRDNMRRFKRYESPQEREDRLSKLATGYKAGRWAFGGKYEQVEVEQMDEVTKKEAEAVLGGSVKSKPKMPPGKQPAGYRYVRGLARKAMKAGMKKEEVEQIDEAFDKSSPSHAKAKELISNYGNRSAARAVYHGDGSATIHTTGDKKVSSATRVDHIHDQAGLGYNRSAEAYRNSSKSKGGLKFKTKETEGKSIYGSHEIHISHKGMKEEVEQVDEKAPPGAKFERMVKHIKKGYAKGGLTKQEKGIAYATAWKAYGKKEEVETTEETEQVDEKYMGFKAVMASAKKGGARDPAAVAAAIGRKKYGKEKFQAAAAAGKKLGEGMDAVGREDKDIDNDGDTDKTDVYLHNKRKAIGNAIRKKLTAKLEKKDGE